MIDWCTLNIIFNDSLSILITTRIKISIKNIDNEKYNIVVNSK